MNQIEIIKGLIEVMQSAIDSGDWNIDGACDPYSIMSRAAKALREEGYDLDGLTGTEWIKL